MTRKPGTSFGDLLADFQAKWKASKEQDTEETLDDIRKPCSPGQQIRNFGQTLRSWRKGGADVTVVKAKPGCASSTSRQVNGALGKSERPPSQRNPLEQLSKPGNSRRLIQNDQPDSAPSFGVNGESESSAVHSVDRKKPALERLRDISSDVRKLKIRGAQSRAIGDWHMNPVLSEDRGKLAILGLDFGTAYTKAVVRWAGNHHAVDWSLAVKGDDPYLLASSFSEHPDGKCVLGTSVSPVWIVCDGIKLRLLSSKGLPTSSDMEDAVIFVALALQYANKWLRVSRSCSDDQIRWQLHLGLPTESWDDNETSNLFKSIARAARLLASSRKNVSRSAASSAIAKAQATEQPGVDVFPEFSCQLFSYLRSTERQDDLHALVDIGAGTLDVAFFNVFSHEDEMRIPIFAASVEKLGAHYLIAALAGGEGGRRQWDDEDSSMTDAEVAKKLRVSVNGIAARRETYLSSVATIFHDCRKSAKQAYITSPAFRAGATVRLFICGGGSRIGCLRNRFELIQSEAVRFGINFQLSDLVRPSNIVGKFGSNFDRLSVAYGLSQPGANLGSVMRRADLSPLIALLPVLTKDRDEDR